MGQRPWMLHTLGLEFAGWKPAPQFVSNPCGAGILPA